MPSSMKNPHEKWKCNLERIKKAARREKKKNFCTVVKKPISRSSNVLCEWRFSVALENIFIFCFSLSNSAVTAKIAFLKEMGLNRLLSLSKSSVIPDLKQVNSKSSKNSSKSAKLEQTEKCNKKESETQKIDKTLKNGKSATTAKRSMLWTLRITNKSKNGLKKGKF